jgi:hypothetical protein
VCHAERALHFHPSERVERGIFRSWRKLTNAR